MKNPCFWEDYRLNGDPYADSPYAPEIGKTIQYDPWGHTAYYKKARDRFNAHLITGEDGNTKRLRCLPYFYLISTPKSGTTTLWNQLRNEFSISMNFNGQSIRSVVRVAVSTTYGGRILFRFLRILKK